MMRRGLTSLTLASALVAVSCGGATPPAPAAPPPAPPLAPLPTIAPSAAAPAPTDAPPPPGIAPDWKFPAIKDQPAKNGMLVRLVERHALPVVQLELVVQSGSASDGDKPGLAVVAGELLKAGGAGKWTSRALLDAAESLGSSLEVTTDLVQTKDHSTDDVTLPALDFTKPGMFL